MTLETCDLWDICSEWWENMTWPKKIDKDKYKDKDKDKDKDILRTPPKSNPRDLWPLRHLFRVMRRHDMTKKIDKDKYKYKDNDKDILRTPPKSNPRDLLHLRHWLQFWQLRTWIHDNLCDLTINCDTGQHSQFLRCFYLFMRFMRFEIFIRIKRLICMKGILTLTHGQH